MNLVKLVDFLLGDVVVHKIPNGIDFSLLDRVRNGSNDPLG